MQAVITQGWLEGARRVSSPFFDARPQGVPISLLVVHNISLPPGQFGGHYIEDFFQGRLDPNEHPFFQVIHQMRVSAHCVIKRDGEVVQFVSFDDRAWHAGASSFAGIERCNDYSIGIELEGSDDLPFEDAQYETLVHVTACLQQAYPQIQQHLAGHSDIAPGRKTDPGAFFDWLGYRNRLQQLKSQ